jgi:hypothetical protein
VSHPDRRYTQAGYPSDADGTHTADQVRFIDVDRMRVVERRTAPWALLLERLTTPIGLQFVAVGQHSQ